MQWIIALLSLVGALFGGVMSALVTNRLSERTGELERIKQARIAVERWYAARVSPVGAQYPGVDQSLLDDVNQRTLTRFFDRYFEESYNARTALGAIRQWDDRIGSILDEVGWRLPEERIDELRAALGDAERRVRHRWWSNA